jgi:hypothetical protein
MCYNECRLREGDTMTKATEEGKTMEDTIGRATLTTEHPASSYGVATMVLDDVAYGPEDMLDALMAGSHVVSTVAGFTECTFNADTLKGWLRQSADHGPRWVASIDRWLAALIEDEEDENA